ncbi:MAG: ABC transporter substrate-binding protein, partial [Dehalococcoidia bacterium]
MNKNLWLIPLALLLAISLVIAGCTTAKTEKEEIVFGQSVSVTGALGSGNAVASTPYYDLWVHDVNAEGGLYIEDYGQKLPVDLVIYDDTSDVAIMTRQLEKLITEDEVDFILPPWSTAMLFAAAPIANKHEYILIGGAGGAASLKEVRLPYFFQVLNFSDTQVPTLADILVELGVEKV